MTDVHKAADTLKEAAEKALKAIEYVHRENAFGYGYLTWHITNLRAALAAEKKPGEVMVIGGVEYRRARCPDETNGICFGAQPCPYQCESVSTTVRLPPASPDEPTSVQERCSECGPTGGKCSPVESECGCIHCMHCDRCIYQDPNCDIY